MVVLHNDGILVTLAVILGAVVGILYGARASSGTTCERVSGRAGAARKRAVEKRNGIRCGEVRELTGRGVHENRRFEVAEAEVALGKGLFYCVREKRVERYQRGSSGRGNRLVW